MKKLSLLVVMLATSNLYATDAYNNKEYKVRQTLQNVTMTGSLSMGANALSAGSITGSSVTITGNAFSVGGSTLVVSGGKVGIGMIPARTLDVTGTFGATGNATFSSAIIVANTRGSLTTGVSNSANFSVQSSAARSLELYAEGTPGLGIFISSGTGNVGIGTTAPSQKLDISSGTLHMAGTGTPAVGAALCLTAAGVMGTCTGGTFTACTCTAP